MHVLQVGPPVQLCFAFRREKKKQRNSTVVTLIFTTTLTSYSEQLYGHSIILTAIQNLMVLVLSKFVDGLQRYVYRIFSCIICGDRNTTVSMMSCISDISVCCFDRLR